jgi:hypothetical protein
VVGERIKNAAGGIEMILLVLSMWWLKTWHWFICLCWMPIGNCLLIPWRHRHIRSTYMLVLNAHRQLPAHPMKT